MIASNEEEKNGLNSKETLNKNKQNNSKVD